MLESCFALLFLLEASVPHPYPSTSALQGALLSPVTQRMQSLTLFPAMGCNLVSFWEALSLLPFRVPIDLPGWGTSLQTLQLGSGNDSTSPKCVIFFCSRTPLPLLPLPSHRAVGKTPVRLSTSEHPACSMNSLAALTKAPRLCRQLTQLLKNAVEMAGPAEPLRIQTRSCVHFVQ